MSAKKWLQDKWVNRVRQFGLRVSLAQAVRAAVRPVWCMNRDLILAIPNHQPNQPEYPEIQKMTVQMVEKAAQKGKLTQREENRLKRFLDQGCWGFLAEIENRFSGYIFIQPEGIYTFGNGGNFLIPEGMMVLKNLLVFPEFRGRSLGKYLNQACIAAIPAGHTPIIFVMTENRIAIRNVKMFGFKEMLIVTQTTWFKKWTRQTVKILHSGDISQKLMYGLQYTRNTEKVNCGHLRYDS